MAATKKKSSSNTAQPTSETRSFNAEVGKVLHLMIHSLYTNKDIFLRELISNASDACDKLRYLALSNEGMLKDHPGFSVRLSINKDARQLIIEDTGIGMSREELIDNLGTVARSGTQQFVEQMASKQDGTLIGQFGVGFYSSFMVADEVEVISQKAGETECWQWSSRGEGEFSIASHTPLPHCGTRITLHIREGEDDYLDKFRIRHIVKTYSDHIAIPIELISEEGKTDILNSQSALWMRPKSDITPEQYTEFYHHIAHAGDTPWMTLHNKNEGAVEFTNLLYVPTNKPFDLFHPERRTRVKLYVKRVYINDEGVDIIPSYLRFVRGVIDSEDLPLNISRESLQHNQVIGKIKKSVVKRVLKELLTKSEKEPEAYQSFWDNFGAVLKEGLCDGGQDQEDILRLCRFYSTHSDNLTSLDDYIARMPSHQKSMYYLTGDNLETLRDSPQLEGCKERGIEVLLFTDPVDDFWVNVVHEYHDTAMQSITRSTIDLDATEGKDADTDEAKKDASDELPAALTPALEFIQKALEGKVAEVKPTSKLKDTPACLGVKEGAMDIRMERFLVEQKQLASRSLKVLEVNMKHPLIHYLEDQLTAGTLNDAEGADIAALLYDQACIIEGEPLENASAFTKRLSRFMSKALHLDVA